MDDPPRRGEISDVESEKAGSIDKPLLKLDEASGFGRLPSDDETLAFWEKKDFIHIKP